MTKKVITYCRVSTKVQSQSGLGLEAQREAIERYARRHDYEIVETIAEVASGGGSGCSLEHRPALAKALEVLFTTVHLPDSRHHPRQSTSISHSPEL